MNELLQIIGSVASIASIPLAVFLYLRQREAKFRKLRSEIAKTLSYKIGEDSVISLFELESVIESKAREYGINPALIPPDGIIEDLVADTISNPMLESERKKKVVENLQDVHKAGVCYRILNDYSEPLSNSIYKLSKGFELEPEVEGALKSKSTEDLGKIASKPKPVFETLSTTFGVLSAIITIIISIFGITTLKELNTFFIDNKQLLALILGVLSSLIAGLLTGIMSKKSRKLSLKRKDNEKK
ncbi:MAG: hypothetical protein DRH50_07725 [Deltaproteobacteria bacterium]|nr:MAG: hypothetical protein DRH50_07725 [Deltaproteobacteria bacterium]